MHSIEIALAYDFVDPADTSITHRLEFRHHAPGDTDPHLANPVGQLWAVVRGFHPLRGTAVPVSRAGVLYNDVVAAMGPAWPWRGGYQIDLVRIRERLHVAGLARRSGWTPTVGTGRALGDQAAIASSASGWPARGPRRLGVGAALGPGVSGTVGRLADRRSDGAIRS